MTHEDSLLKVLFLWLLPNTLSENIRGPTSIHFNPEPGWLENAGFHLVWALSGKGLGSMSCSLTVFQTGNNLSRLSLPLGESSGPREES